MHLLRHASTLSSFYVGPRLLGPAAVQQFWRDGYLRLPSVVPPQLRPKLIDWANEVKSWPGKTDKEYMQYEEIGPNGERILCTSENFALYHKGWNNILRGPELLQRMSELLGTKAFLFKEKINYKLPNGGGYPPHTDASSYIHIDKDVQTHVSVLIAIQKATPENGCLEVVRGSHRIKLEPESPTDRTISRAWANKQEWISLPMEPGDALVFDSYLAHRSSDNKSSQGRASLYATYNGGKDLHAKYYKHRAEHWPPTAQRVPDHPYEKGAAVYAWATPMETVEKGQKPVGTKL